MILDTNAVSAFGDGEPRAVERIRSTQEIAIPVIVLGEFRFGIASSRHRPTYEQWLSDLIATVRVLDIIEETSRVYATIRAELKQAGTPIPANDAWIAALCRQHALPIMSRDGHFDSVSGLQRVDW